MVVGDVSTVVGEVLGAVLDVVVGDVSTVVGDVLGAVLEIMKRET